MSDAQLNAKGDNWAYNNSNTDHKLLRLMEADGWESIEKNYSADAGDFYTSNRYFSDLTTPNSKSYSLTRTGINIFNIYWIGTRLVPFAKTKDLGYPANTFSVDFQISSSNVIGLNEAVDNDTLTFTSGGSTLGLGWTGQSTTSYFGGDAARSIKPGDGKYSQMSASVTGPATLKFYWKVSSEKNADTLQFLVDSIVQDQISGEMAWAQKIVQIPAGKHALYWKYLKNGSVASGSDCGWVDKIECGTVSLNEALDNPFLTFSTSGFSLWSGQGLDFYYAGSAAQSGPLGDGKTATIYTNVTGPGQLHFYWKVSSEWNGDFLQFWIDSVKQQAISGEVDWSAKTFSIPAGTHQIAWQYQKNASTAQGADCGLLDKVAYSEGTTLGTLANGVDNVELSWSSTGDVPWFYTNTVYSALRGNYDSVQSDVPAGKKSTLNSAVVGPGTLSFWWKRAGSASADIDFLIDAKYQTFCPGSDWSQKTINVAAGIHTLQWTLMNYGAVGSESGWVDRVVYTPEVATLAEAVDTTAYPITTYGTAAGWSPISDTSAFGSDSAKSGGIGMDQYSFFETTIRGPGQLLFSWKVSSEQDHGYLNFILDNVNKSSITGSVAWQEKSFILSPGEHQISWFYNKDTANVVGSDCAWLDHIRVKPLPSLPEALDNKTLGWNTYASSVGGEWVGQPTTAFFGGSAAQSGPVANKQKSTLVTEVTGPGTLNFYWKVSCHDFWNYLSFSIGTYRLTRVLGAVGRPDAGELAGKNEDHQSDRLAAGLDQHPGGPGIR